MPQNFIWSSRPIFISSTFTDMNAERDVLWDIITSDLQVKLDERRVRLDPIDFRWGIDTSDEKETEKKELMVLKVCLDDIDRSKPFFIGLIGDRYGSVPPEKRMKDAEKEKGFESKLKDKSITALEIEYGVLESKEQLKRSFFFFREPLPYNDMPEDVKTLYYDSDPDKQNRLKELKEKIEKAVGKDRVFTYKAGWDGAKNTINKVTGLKDFKEKIEKVLWDELDAATKALERTRPKTWEEEEQNYLQDFIADRVISFEGREDVIEDLKKFVLSESGYDNWGKCVAGESGSGKSALIAKLYVELNEEKDKGKDIILLAHAAGISLRSNSLDNMLTIWIKELAKELSIDVSKEFEEKTGGPERQLSERTGLDGAKSKGKSKFEDLINLFANLLSRVAVNKRVVVLVDALNQFDRTEQAKHVSWLPALIPQNSKFIFTSIQGAETENLSKPGMSVEKLKDIKEEDARNIIKALCDRYHKTLSKEATEILLKKEKEKGIFAHSNPLWLTMVINDFLLMDEDDFGLMKGLEGTPEQKLAQLLIRSAEKIPADAEGMYEYVFERCNKFGEEFVNAVLSYIGISRNGLRERDLEELIKNYTGTKWENLNFASFRRYLKNHLVQKGELGLWDFRHVKARESLKNSLLKDEQTVIELHKNLSSHLDKLTEEDPLRLTEIIWHLFKCDDKRRASIFYGSNSIDQGIINNYSETIKDILQENENNVKWICSLVELSEIEDITKHNIIYNFISDLNEKLKDYVYLPTRLEISLAAIKSSEELLNRDSKYAMDLFWSLINAGDIHEKSGDLNKALEKFTKAWETEKEFNEYLKHPIDNFYILILFERLSGLYDTMGQLKKAMELYFEILMIFEEHHAGKPWTLLTKSMYATQNGRIAKAYQKMGQLDNALKFYLKSLATFKELYDDFSQNFSIISNLIVSYKDLGRIYLEMGQSEKALKYAENSRELAEVLFSNYPQSLSNKNELAESYCGLGSVHFFNGEFDNSLINYKEYMKLSQELNELYPQNVTYEKNVALSYELIGSVYDRMNFFDLALNFYQKSNNLFEDLCMRHPRDFPSMHGLANSHISLGTSFFKLERLDNALDHFKKAGELLENLKKNYPEIVSIKYSLVDTHKRMGIIYEGKKQLSNALTQFMNYKRISEELHENFPKGISEKNEMALSFLKLAGVLLPTNIEEATKLYKKANEVYTNLLHSDPGNSNFNDKLQLVQTVLASLAIHSTVKK